MSAIDECRERIAAGEIFQANLCLRLDADWKGDPLDLFARTAGTLEPRHAGVVAGPWGAVCSLSPELFLRRRGREVVTEPIKGTAPRVLAAGREGSRAEDARAALAASVKDRAENVMIVDLMRNDLGRVCEYGSIEVSALNEPRPAPGVWHLVSTVRGRLRPEAGDSDLLRASFPPGSVTGAPKIQAMRVIAELEAGGREAYTGARRIREPGRRPGAERRDPDAGDARRADLDGRGRRHRGRLGRGERARGVLREGAPGHRGRGRPPDRGAARDPGGAGACPGRRGRPPDPASGCSRRSSSAAARPSTSAPTWRALRGASTRSTAPAAR